jgi:hypothetical protein
MQDGEGMSPYLHRATGHFPVIGETIFHYHILAKLGGGTGMVYKAQIGMASLQGLAMGTSYSPYMSAPPGSLLDAAQIASDNDAFTGQCRELCVRARRG